MSLDAQPLPVETWSVRKSAVESAGGVVASQSYLASDVGARVLADGGNAVDAAVATGLAIGAVEPWMSGLGGGGFMMIYLAEEGRTHAVDFGMRAARALDPADYPLAGAAPDADLFGWPAVVEDRNVFGPLSIATPGFVAGHALALSRFGTRSFAESIAPAVALAREGMVADWYATVEIASEARTLARYPESARTYLPDGFVPAGSWSGQPPRIRLGRLADTLERLAAAGPEDFYRGDVARDLVADLDEAGARVAAADLAQYSARVVPVEAVAYRGHRIHPAPGLTAGPTLVHALSLVESRLAAGAPLDAAAYATYVEALRTAYAHRLETMGDIGESGRAPTCTTHITVADRHGNVVSLTQTLLSLFGSKVMLPRTGVMMNNGVMWFDPRPGRPNSMAPGKRPLSNMCPTVVTRADGGWFGLGASGGRRIMPAVMQVLSFVLDHGMSIEEACHQPRIDVSGGPRVGVDGALPRSVADVLAARFDCDRVTHAVFPSLFARPNVVGYDPARGVATGCAYVMSPWAKASAA